MLFVALQKLCKSFNLCRMICLQLASKTRDFSRDKIVGTPCFEEGAKNALIANSGTAGGSRTSVALATESSTKAFSDGFSRLPSLL